MKLSKNLLSVAVPVLLAGQMFAAMPTPQMKQDMNRFKVRPQASSASISFSPSSVQVSALGSLRTKTGSPWKARFSSVTGVVSTLSGGSNIAYSGSPDDAALAFLKDYQPLLLVNPSNLKLEKSAKSIGINHLVFRQYQNGIPVDNGTVKVHISDSGEIIYYQSSYRPDISVSEMPGLSAASAVSAAEADCGGKAAGTPSLVYFTNETDGKVYLAWKVKAAASGTTPGRWYYYVDANTGAVLFRYSGLEYATSGTVTGQVYDLFPRGTPPDYALCSTVTFRNQYVWVRNYTSSATTASDGTYSHTVNGKMFASLKGPYFAVNNFQGLSAHYDNGSGTWGTETASGISTPHPYVPGTTYVSTVTLSSLSPAASAYLAKVAPHFKTGFQVGEMDINSNITVADELVLLNPANGQQIAANIGTRSQAFLGSTFEGNSYVLQLAAASSGPGTLNGYEVDVSSYLYLTDNPTVPDDPTSTFTWAAENTAPIYTPVGYLRGVGEMNAFYHLNEMHEYYNVGVNSTSVVNLNFLMPVMVHAHGTPDTSTDGMLNAFYDAERKNMMFGDGLWDDTIQKYRSFALDATIIRHEYTHAVMDRIYPMVYFGESGAISEAIADYFSLSSLRQTDSNYTPKTSSVGEFLGFGEGATRTLTSSGCPTPSSNCKVYPTSWVSEVHDDSLMLSQALWEMRYSSYSYTWLGNRTEGPRADTFVFNALYFFPDTFVQFRDAMETVCRYIEGTTTCNSSYLQRMTDAFVHHGIVAKSTSAYTDSYEPDDGPEMASNISTSPIVATIYPEYDADYYSLSLPKGQFTATINLPTSEGHEGAYHAFWMFLYDANRSHLVDVLPELDPDSKTLEGTCPSTGECFTRQATASISYTVPKAGRYLLAVTGGPNSSYFNCGDKSTATYTVDLAYEPGGSASAGIVTASYDNDVIRFSVPYNTFYYSGTPTWSSTMTAQVESYDHSALRDQNYYLLDDATTKGTLMSDVSITTDSTNGVITGTVKLNSGFESRYPGVGTVHLEIFGKSRQGNVISLGMSGALNLTSNRNEVKVWNNIFTPNKNSTLCSQFGSDCATVRYDCLSGGDLKMKIFTVDGLLVKDLYNGSVSSGKTTVQWNGRNDAGNIVASGMFLLSVDGPGVKTLEKIIVIR